MAKTKTQGKKIPASFINDLKARIIIHELYTKLTNITFVKDNSRLRARAAWRKDDNPSLTYHKGSNTLTDFADQSNYHNKTGKVYNHIDILIATKTCKSIYDAVLYLANYVGEIIPGDLLKSIQQYTKYQEALMDVYQACLQTLDSMFSGDGYQNRSFQLRSYCKDRSIPFDHDFFKLLEVGIWPARPIIEAICKKYDIDLDKKNDNEISFARFPDEENKALIFPLYNKHGALVGISYRTMTAVKEIKRCILENQSVAMYGLNHAISEKNVAIVEGEMNIVQVAARFWESDPKSAAKAIKVMFSTGSLGNNPKLKYFEGEFNRVFYFNDVQLKDSEDKIKTETVDNVIDVYNYLKALEFKTVYWHNQRDKYDLDDYLREHIEDGHKAYLHIFKSHSLKKTLAEFLYETIESKVKDFDDNVKDSARFAFCERFNTRLWNEADKNQLRVLYADVTNVDPDIVQHINNQEFTQIGNSPYYIKNNAYWIEEIVDKQSGLKEKIQISDFIIRGNFKMISLGGTKKPKSEDVVITGERAEIYANIHFQGSKIVKGITFQSEHFVDYKKFWANVFATEIDLIDKYREKREEAIFYCIKNTLITVTSKISFSTPGPHIKTMDTEGFMETLRPNLFVQGGTLKTFLNKNVSIIDGKVIPNSFLNIDLAKCTYYKFGICTEEELVQTSHMLWYKLRYLHETLLMDGLIGYAMCAPIKHILDPNVNGLHLFLLGQSNSHKTSLARIIQNFYGDFATDDRVAAFSNSTPKYLEQSIQRTGSAICVCDEFKISKEYTIEMMNHIIHHIFNGVGRGKLNSQSAMIDPNYFNSNVITTAEYTQDFETSAEARYLRFMVPTINTEKLYNDINGSENLPKFKTFTPYLIAWQHQNIELLQERYKFYKQTIEKVIEDEPNKGRVAMQMAMIMIGFYSFCRFIAFKNVCTEEEAEKEIQKLLLYFLSNAKVQAGRSTGARMIEKFKEYVAQGINTRKINMGVIVYDQNDKYKDHHWTQSNNMVCNIWKYRKNPKDESSIYYSIVSWTGLLNDLKRLFNCPFTESLKYELVAHGYLQLDNDGNIQGVKVPNPVDPGGKLKNIRAVVLPESMFNVKELTDDREPEGF
jgi:hypothetical protein